MVAVRCYRRLSSIPAPAIHLFILCLVLTPLDSSLTSEAVNEPGCLTDMEPAKNMSFTFLMELVSGGNFYVPMGSKSAYYLWAELLKGSPLNNEEELSTLCPMVNVQMSTVTLTAYGHRLQQHCNLIKLGVVNCTLDTATPQPEGYCKADAISTFTWTDNSKHVLLIGCIGGRSKSWALYSFEEKVDENTKREVLEIVTKKGFDTTKIFNYSYEKCPSRRRK